MMFKISAIPLTALLVAMSFPSAQARDVGRHHGYQHPSRVEARPHRHLRGEAERRRDPLGIIQRQGVSSRHGGMGNMGGGSGRSANTGVGLGAHGNSQGPRF